MRVVVPYSYDSCEAHVMIFEVPESDNFEEAYAKAVIKAYFGDDVEYAWDEETGDHEVVSAEAIAKEMAEGYTVEECFHERGIYLGEFVALD